MKSCMEMVQGVRNEMSTKSTQHEDRYAQLRSEVAAEVSALNFDMHGLLEFKNRSSYSGVGIKLRGIKLHFRNFIPSKVP